MMRSSSILMSVALLGLTLGFISGCAGTKKQEQPKPPMKRSSIRIRSVPPTYVDLDPSVPTDVEVQALLPRQPAGQSEEPPPGETSKSVEGQKPSSSAPMPPPKTGGPPRPGERRPAGQTVDSEAIFDVERGEAQEREEESGGARRGSSGRAR